MEMNKKKRMQKGFSLLEMAIVVALFGIMVAIGLPNGASVKTAANYSGVKAAIHSVQAAEAIYENNNHALGTIAQMRSANALVADPLVDLPIGTTAVLSVVNGDVAGAGAVPDGFVIGGNATVVTEKVAQVTLTAVSPEDALALGAKIDSSSYVAALNAASTVSSVEHDAILANATGDVVIMVSRR